MPIYKRGGYGSQYYAIVWCNANKLFEVISNKYGKSWKLIRIGIENRIKEKEQKQLKILEKKDNRRNMLITSLEKHGLGSNETDGLLANEFINGKLSISPDDCAYEIMKRIFYHRHTNYDSIAKSIYKRYRRTPNLHQVLREYFNRKINIPKILPWNDKNTKQFYEVKINYNYFHNHFYNEFDDDFDDDY